VTYIYAPQTGEKAEGLRSDGALPFDETIRWLLAMRPKGRWVLTAICPDMSGEPETRTFEPDNANATRDWLGKWNGKRNLYWTPNTVRDDANPNKKPSELDIVDVDFLHVDIDPHKDVDPADTDAWGIERARILTALEGFGPSPSAIVDSGNGYQGFWRLDQPFFVGGKAEGIKQAKPYNVALRDALGGDNCQSLEHLMRLPDTRNLPNPKKRDAGRIECIATVVRWPDKERTYGLGLFDSAEPESAAGTSAPGKVSLERGDIIRLTETEELDQWNVPGWAKAVIVQGEHPTEPDKWGGDRSRAVFAATCELVARQVPPERIVGILTDADLGISAHILAQKRHIEYAWEQVERATAAVATRTDNFATDKNDVPIANHQGNIRLAVRKLGIELRHDTFADRALIEGLDGFGPHLDDAALTRLWLTIDERYRFRPHIEFFSKVIMDAVRNAAFHPVLDYLDALEWDGTPRLERWLSTYGGADDNEYTRAVGTLVTVAAVRRVRQPGVKFDEMLTLESAQGTNKSSALRVMAVRDEWFVDDLPLNAEGKVVIERLAGRWIAEAGELKGMRKGDVEHLKAFLSRQEDTARMSYARLPVIVPRQCVIIGTTNSDRYLRDLTGNRRFWPVRVETFDLDALRRDRDQLWAEAAKREAEGASIRLDPSLYAAAGAEQEARRVDDPFVESLSALLGDRAGKLRAADVWKLLGIPAGQQTQDQNARVGDAMRELGWNRTKRRFGGSPEHAYVRGNRVEMERSIAVCFGVSGWYVDDAPSGEPVGGGGDGELPY